MLQSAVRQISMPETQLKDLGEKIQTEDPSSRFGTGGRDNVSPDRGQARCQSYVTSPPSFFTSSTAAACCLARVISVCSQPNVRATATISRAQTGWRIGSAGQEQCGEKPQEHDEEGNANPRHGDQDGQTLVAVEGKQLQPLGEEEEPGRGQGKYDHPTRSRTYPSAFGSESLITRIIRT